jgi:S-DNA-T family DNA segregation ATPase FtsK/SpoIIIE
MILIDPKMLEMSVYEGIPHLLAPVVTDMRQAGHALNWAVAEMERRYKLMSKLGVRNLAGYNGKIEDANKKEEKIPNPFSLTPDAPEPLDKLPTIVIIIDELADLMMVVGKKVEELIARIAQKARAAGIHLILATQRPSVDVITGLIKANFPSRIAFHVTSKIDSRTILDQNGAEALLGAGDMLFSDRGGAPQRFHGCYVDEEEIQRVVTFLKTQARPVYNLDILKPRDEEGEGNPDIGGAPQGKSDDDMYDKAVYIVTTTRNASISWVQRQLRIGYNRAARIVEEMEKQGVVSPPDHTNKREVLVAA